MEEGQSVWFQHILNGGIVNNAETALALAEVLLVHAYGRSHLEEQRPLTVTGG